MTLSPIQLPSPEAVGPRRSAGAAEPALAAPFSFAEVLVRNDQPGHGTSKQGEPPAPAMASAELLNPAAPRAFEGTSDMLARASAAAEVFNEHGFFAAGSAPAAAKAQPGDRLNSAGTPSPRLEPLENATVTRKAAQPGVVHTTAPGALEGAEEQLGLSHAAGNANRGERNDARLGYGTRIDVQSSPLQTSGPGAAVSVAAPPPTASKADEQPASGSIRRALRVPTPLQLRAGAASGIEVIVRPSGSGAAVTASIAGLAAEEGARLERRIAEELAQHGFRIGTVRVRGAAASVGKL